jgi:uncharacterized membrane protein YhaH (DUF805 family)
MNWYLKVFKQYFDFSGRARRKEYWMYILFNFIALFLLMLIDITIGTTFSEAEVGIFYLTYMFLSIIPGLAVSVRRLHDLGKSGAWFFINLIPFVGPLWFLILTCMEGENRQNNWGENPKGVGNDLSISQIGKE